MNSNKEIKEVEAKQNLLTLNMTDEELEKQYSPTKPKKSTRKSSLE